MRGEREMERERERDKERERERSICSAYLYIHWLLLVCALTGDRTHNLGVWGGGHSNQLSYKANAIIDLPLLI